MQIFDDYYVVRLVERTDHRDYNQDDFDYVTAAQKWLLEKKEDLDSDEDEWDFIWYGAEFHFRKKENAIEFKLIFG